MAQYDYNPYGKQEQLSGNTASDFGYTGFHQEPAAGLDLALYRAYDPTKGKWLSRDPMGESTGADLYGYAGDSPFNDTDPLGLYDPNSWWGRYLYSDQSATHEFLYGQEETQAITGVVVATASVAGGEVLAGFGEAAEAGEEATVATEEADLTLSAHAEEAMAEHGVTPEMVKNAIRTGERYYDPKNDSLVHVVRNAFGHNDLGVARDIESGIVKTVMKNANIIRPRFIPWSW